MDEDRTLYRQVKMGDQEALRLLIARYHRPLFDFLYRLMDDRSTADDLTQQAFIRLLTFSGDAPDNLRAWLFTIAHNLAYDYFRSAHRRHENSLDFADGADLMLPETADTLEQMTIFADDQQTIARLLQSLPPEQREVVILRFYHDLSLQAIADVVNVPLGTVKSRLFHALKKLKLQWIVSDE